MAKKKHKKKSKSHKVKAFGRTFSSKKHHPTARAKKAYNSLIVKSYKRLHAVVKKHAPSELLSG